VGQEAREERGGEVMNWCLPLLLLVPMYAESSVSLAGVELRLGMSQDAVLAKFAAKSDVKLDELEPNWYSVAVKGTGALGISW
jgi:hypothetical protein